MPSVVATSARIRTPRHSAPSASAILSNLWKRHWARASCPVTQICRNSSLTPTMSVPSLPTLSPSRSVKPAHELPHHMSSALFSPYRLAGLELANRIVVSPMCQYSADDGCANDWHLSHLGMLANSGAALVIVEATHVERHGRITHGCLGLYSDDNEAALARVIAQARRMGSAKFGIQIAHSGRKGSAQRPWEGAVAHNPVAVPWPTVVASPIPFGEGRHTQRA